MKISQCTTGSFKNLSLPSINRCLAKSQELQSAERLVGAVEVVPGKVADIVLNKSDGLLLHRERRALPYFILDSRFKGFNPEFGGAVLRNFSDGRAFWSTLFNAWLFHYCLGRQEGQAVRKALIENRSRLSDKQRKLDASFNILHPKPNLHKVALLILQGVIEADTLQDINFSNEGVPGGKFSIALMSGFAMQCMSKSLSDSELKRLVEILCPHGSLHESVRDVALVSLIFSIKDRARDADIVLGIKEIINSNFKDPRIYSHEWPAIPDELGGEKTRGQCIEFVKQWHIFKSISLFFKIIEEVVEGAEYEHHFPERRKFWIDYFDRGLVSDAWVILGVKGASQANRYKQSGDLDFASLTWAKLSASQSDQCVLLMQIGNATVVEWSHSGACRIWRSNDSNAPKLSKLHYDGTSLRAAVADDSRDRIRHDPGGAWKFKITQRINSYSGRRRFV